jgi:hypothetical protein
VAPSRRSPHGENGNRATKAGQSAATTLTTTAKAITSHTISAVSHRRQKQRFLFCGELEEGSEMGERERGEKGRERAAERGRERERERGWVQMQLVLCQQFSAFVSLLCCGCVVVVM